MESQKSAAVKLTALALLVLRSAVYPVKWKGLMLICCGLAVKMKALNVKMVIRKVR